jgi:hypothetical protein
LIDYNDCPTPDTALTLWKSYLLDYETKFWDMPPWEIMREGDTNATYQEFSENFLFAHGQAAFVSIDLVNGDFFDAVEYQRRQEADLAWVDTAYEYYGKVVSTIVIFAHDGPPGVSQNAQFYIDLFSRIKNTYSDMDFVLVYRGESSFGLTEKYQGMQNLDVISVLGPIWPPLRMTIDFTQQPRKITLSDSWYNATLQT